MASKLHHKSYMKFSIISLVLFTIVIYLSNNYEFEMEHYENREDGQEIIKNGRRNLLSNWKKKRMCPPGLDLCRQEEKQKADEIAEKKKLREEAEAAEAAALEKAAQESASERMMKKAEREAIAVEKKLKAEQAEKEKREAEAEKKRRENKLFKSFMKDRKRDAPTAEDLRLLNLDLKYREKAAASEPKTAEPDVIDQVTAEPKEWKKKRHSAVHVALDVPEVAAAAVEAEEEHSLLAIGRAAELAANKRKLGKNKGKHHHNKYDSTEGGEMSTSAASSSQELLLDRPNANKQGGAVKGRRPKSAEELVKEGLSAGRRILVYASASSGGSLLAYMLAQLPNTVAILNLRNSQLPPSPEDLADVPSESNIVVKCSADSEYSLFDYVKVFRPHMKVLLVRHPAHIRAGLLRAKLDSYREMAAPDVVLTKLEAAYVGSEKRYDAVFLYEETVWNRVLTEQKLHSIGFNKDEIDKMYMFNRPVTAVVAYSQQKSKWIMDRKMVGWDTGNVKKLGAGADTIKASLIDRKPSLDDRSQATLKCPTLSKMYRAYYPELDAAEGVAEWVVTVQLLMKMVHRRKDPTANMILMTIADHRWQDMVVNWMAALHRLGNRHYMVVSADSQLHDALQRIGAPSFYHSVFFNPYGGPASGGDEAAKAERFRGAIWSYKWQLIGSVLKRGVHVLSMDVDSIAVRPFSNLIESNPGSHLIVGRGSKQVDEVIGTSFIYMKSSPQILSFLPKFITLTNKVLDDHRAINLILNTGFVRWSTPPLQDGQVVDGVAKSGVKVSILPNLQVRAHCDTGEYPAQTATIVHCKIPRAHKPEVRSQMLTKYGVWLLRENFQFVEFPGNFESWLDVIIDTRSLAYTVMTTGSKKGNSLFSVGMPKAPPTMIGLNQAPVIPVNKAPRMGRGIGLGQP